MRISHGWRELMKTPYLIFEDMGDKVEKDQWPTLSEISKHYCFFHDQRDKGNNDPIYNRFSYPVINSYRTEKTVRFQLSRSYDVALGITITLPQGKDSCIDTVVFTQNYMTLSTFTNIPKGNQIFIPIGAVDAIPMCCVVFCMIDCEITGKNIGSIEINVEGMLVDNNERSRICCLKSSPVIEWPVLDMIIYATSWNVDPYLSTSDIKINQFPREIIFPEWFHKDLVSELARYIFKIWMFISNTKDPGIPYATLNNGKLYITSTEPKYIPPYAKCEIPRICRLQYFKQSGHLALPPFCVVYPIFNGDLEGYKVVD
jgi:hypothetical protein